MCNLQAYLVKSKYFLVHKELCDDKTIAYYIEKTDGFKNILVTENLIQNCQKIVKPIFCQNSELPVLSVLNNLKNYYVPVLLPTYRPSLSKLLMNLLNSQGPRK